MEQAELSKKPGGFAEGSQPRTPGPKGSPRGAASSSGQCKAAAAVGAGDTAEAAPALPSLGGSPVSGTEPGGGNAAGKEEAGGAEGLVSVLFRSSPHSSVIYPLE